jgi:hypothetical protein
VTAGVRKTPRVLHRLGWGPILKMFPHALGHGFRTHSQARCSTTALHKFICRLGDLSNNGCRPATWIARNY